MSDSESKKIITLFFGGVLNLGRNMNVLIKKMEPFVGIEEMFSADCRLVDLECVIASKGQQRNLKKHFYFRAKPEQINILKKAGVDIVLTANDHSGDYGSEALLEQREYLDAAGILSAGSGKNFDEAFAPVYKKVGDITLAIFSVDTTKKSYAASEEKPGIAHLPEKDLALWENFFAERIREAHEKADVVIIAPHWGINGSQKPSEQMRKLAHFLIDLGADAVLGSHSHFFKGVENYKDRPIIYDAGDFLFDSKKRAVGCFTLDISSNGVEKIKFIPLVKYPGQTWRAKKSAAKIQEMFIKECEEFNVAVTTSGGGYRNIIHAAAA